MHRFTKEQREFIIANVKGIGNKELTERFNNHFKINLKVSQIRAYKRNHKISSGLDGKFKKGQKPWNKGLKGITTGGAQTQFKKGNTPHNRVPIGTERIDVKDGYIYVKIQDGHLNKNWKQKHVLIWEQHNGRVPDGHVVLFGDGDKRNFSINNLLLVSKGQLLKLNQHSLIKNNAELTRTGIIIADLYKKISDKRRVQSERGSL